MLTQEQINDAFWNRKYVTRAGRRCLIESIDLVIDALCRKHYYKLWLSSSDEDGQVFRKFDIDAASPELELWKGPHPLTSYPVDTKLLVWDNCFDFAERQHFSHLGPDGKIYCFRDGKTSFSSRISPLCEWRNFQIVNEETFRL